MEDSRNSSSSVGNQEQPTPSTEQPSVEKRSSSGNKSEELEQQLEQQAEKFLGSSKAEVNTVCQSKQSPEYKQEDVHPELPTQQSQRQLQNKQMGQQSKQCSQQSDQKIKAQSEEKRNSLASEEKKIEQKLTNVENKSFVSETPEFLPNEVICIENSQNRIVVHMNRKISTLAFTCKSPNPVSHLLGKLTVTNYRLIYVDQSIPYLDFSFALGFISRVDRSIDQSSGISFIEITLKNGILFKFKYTHDSFEYSIKIKDIILTLLSKNIYVALDFGQFQAQNFLPQPSQSSESLPNQNRVNSPFCESFDSYFPKYPQSLLTSIDAELIDNSDWKQMGNYPQQYIVPLTYIGKRNVDTRIMILSFIYRGKGQSLSPDFSKTQEPIGLWRTGPGLADPYEDQWVPKSVISSSKSIASSTTPKHVTIEIRNKGIGMSKIQTSHWVEIESLYGLRESFYRLNQLNAHSEEPTKWLSQLFNSTKWYEQVTTLMNEALFVINLLTAGSHVSLLCDSEPRGAQICALVQLLLVPEYRTFSGFGSLVEKQFLHFGSSFNTGLSPTKKRDKSTNIQDETEARGVTLIQFFDCVYQFTHFYPLSFEFSEHYLVFLADHVFSNKFGNFLLINKMLKKDSDRRTIQEKCCCIWKDIRNKLHSQKMNFKAESSVTTASQISKDQKSISKNTNSKKQPNHDEGEIETIHFQTYFQNSFYIDFHASNIYELKNHHEAGKRIKLWSSYFLRPIRCQEETVARKGSDFSKDSSLVVHLDNFRKIEKRHIEITHRHNEMKRVNEVMRKKLANQFKQIAEKKAILKALPDF